VKKLIKPIRILKKPTDSIWFQFYKPETEKTESNQKKPNKTEQNKKKPRKIGKTEPNRIEPVFSQNNQTETGRFEPISVFFQKT
jgi:hypothetical protein